MWPHPLYQNQLLRAIKGLCEKYNMTNNVFLEGKEPYLIRAKNSGLTNKLFLTGVVNQENIDIAFDNSFFGICTNDADAQMPSK